MLGILLWVFIYKAFAWRAGQHNKKKWPIGLLGIAVYYFGTFVGGISIVLYLEYFSDSHYDMSGLALNLLSIPFGILTSAILYKILKRYWTKKAEFADVDIVDGELIDRTPD